MPKKLKIDVINFISPVQGWDEYLNGWKSLPDEIKHRMINKACKMALKRLSSASKCPKVTRSTKKRTQPLLKQKKA